MNKILFIALFNLPTNVAKRTTFFWNSAKNFIA